MNPARIARTFDELATRLVVLGKAGRARKYRELAAHTRKASGKKKNKKALGNGLPTWLAAELSELVTTGSFAALDQARAAVPADVVRLAEAEGIGPAVARSVWKRTHVRTLEELADLGRSGFMPKIPGLSGAKRKRLDALMPPSPQGMLLAVAVDAAHLVEEVLRDARAHKVVSVGAMRRGLEIVPRLEVLVTGLAPVAIAAALERADSALLIRDLEVTADGVTCIMQGRGPLVVHATPVDQWPLDLLRLTGDDAHVAWLESRAKPRGGLDALANGALTESEIYARLGLPEIAPELRTGAVGPDPEALLPRNSVRGAFHVHTEWSDGQGTVLTMAREAARAGYEYVGISDHSRAAPYANGLDEKRLVSQKRAVREARTQLAGLTILHGLEVDIMPDGSLDLPDDILASLDFVIGSVHSDTRMAPAAMTKRLVRAVSHPLVTILGHPTGRLLSGKGGYSFDLDAVAKAAAKNDTWIEINANGHRLDVAPALARRAYAHGARFVIDPDAHTAEGLSDVSLGERIARRAGLPITAVVNTCGSKEMVKLLRERKRLALERLDSSGKRSRRK